MDSLIQAVTLYALPVVFAITLHEAAHGYVAKHFGDTTAYALGRVSLNPLRHIDPVGILGSDLETFWQYEDNIRKEYAWVPKSLFRLRRTEILRSFLNREYIYYHEQCRGMFEGKARFNLKQAAAKLSEEGSVL